MWVSELSNSEYEQLPDNVKKLFKRKEDKPVETHYGIDYEDSCHLGEWCGRSGLGCANSNCPLI